MPTFHRHYGRRRSSHGSSKTYAVLFIGYGLNDTLMKYLVRSLSSKAEVYALTNEPGDRRWNQHGVVPVGYQVHEQLPGLIRQWAGMARMGMLDHDRRVAGIVAGAPPLSPEDESYLGAVVDDSERVGLFTRHARGAEWLRWMSSRPQFKRLFDPSASFGRTEHDLKSWYAGHYAVSEHLADEALRLAATNGGLLNRDLWFTLVQSLSRPDRGGARPAATDRWIPVLVETMPPGCNEWLGMLLETCELPRDKHLFLTLFDRIWEPRLAVDRLDSVHMRVRVGAEEPWLPSIGREWLKPNGADLAQDLAPLLDRHLRQFFLLTKIVGSSVEVWELKGLHRTSIENHEREWRDCCLEPLIDMARDVLEVLIADAPEVAGGYLRAWSEHEWPVLRRLAVHGWVKRQDVSVDEKLRWLEESDLLLDRLLRPEVMRLLEAALPVASPASVETTVGRVRGERGDNERYAFDLLGWIVKHAPESAAASGAFAERQALHPDRRPLKDPDFPTWTALPAEDLMEPLELHGLHDRIQADAQTAVARLVDEKDERAGRGVDWTDALDALFSTVVEHFEDGVVVLEVLHREPTAAPDLGRDLGEAVLNGWKHAKEIGSLTDEQCIRIAGFMPHVWELGLQRWGDGKTTFGDSGWLESAENHWAGRIAGLWLEAVLAERRSARDDWSGLSDSAKAALEEMIGGDTKASHFAQVVSATHVHLLVQLDEPWSLSNVLSMFDPVLDECRADRCWEGWLRRGRFDEHLLRAGLLGHFVSMAPRLERLVSRDGGARSAYARLAAGICVDTAIDPVEDDWLSKFVVSSDIETRVAWVQELTRRLSGLSADTADTHWCEWMRHYWEHRLASIPVAMTPEEASAMAEWPAVLGSNYSEAADMAAKSPAPLGHGSRLLYRLAGLDAPRHEKPRPDHVIEHPESTTQLLAHLLQNAETSNDDPRLRHLTEVVARLDKLLDPQRMEPVLNDLLRLGFGEFVGWLQSQRDTANDPTPAASLS